MLGDECFAFGDRLDFIYNAKCSATYPLDSFIASFVLQFHLLLLSDGSNAKRCAFMILFEFWVVELKLITVPPFMNLI